MSSDSQHAATSQLSADLRSALSVRLPEPSAEPKILHLTKIAGQWCKSLSSLVEEIRVNGAMHVTISTAQKLETDNVIAMLTSGMSETICSLAGTLAIDAHFPTDEALETINQQVNLHLKSVALMTEYMKRYV